MNLTDIQELSFSRAKHLLETQKHFLDALTKPDSKTEEMTIGTLLHEVVLEHKSLEGRVAVKPFDMTFSTKEGKAWRAAMLEQEQIIIPEEGYHDLMGMIESLQQSGLNELIGHLDPRREFLMRGSRHGVPIKGYVDAWGPGFVLDIKTARDVSSDGFGRACADRHYLMQAAWYVELATQNGWTVADGVKFVFVSVENHAPYCTVFYEVDLQALEFGLRQMDHCLASFAALKLGSKPQGYPLVQTLTPPPWYLKKPWA